MQDLDLPMMNKLNNHYLLYIYGTFLLICFCGQNVQAQIKLQNIASMPAKLASTVNSYQQISPVEKIYIHTDRSYYSLPDTIRLKAYLLSGLTHSFSTISGLMYVELVSDKNVTEMRIAMPLNIGLSWSQLVLSQNLPDGYYTLRAYTNWMQNAGRDRFFTKRIYIADPNTNGWLVKQQLSMTRQKDKALQKMDLTLTDSRGKSYSNGSLTWAFQAGNVMLDRASVKTDADGHFTVNLPIPDRAAVPGPLNLVINGNQPSQNAIIPVFNDPGDIDLQFMPEGGHLIGGMPIKIGFKAIGANGLGVAVEGEVTDSKGKKIASISSVHKGMGAFTITPQKGEVYKASVKVKNGGIKTFQLPAAALSGISLNVINNPKADSIRVLLKISPNLINNQPILLSGFVNDVPYCEVTIPASGRERPVSFSKALFPSGIVHFTAFNSLGQPVSERAVFVDHKDRLIISAVTSKASYGVNDSIALAISMKNKDGVAVYAGSLSIAVTDDNLVKPDSLENNIASSMLLTSGIKGTIEDPAYYLSGIPAAAEDIDLLLLTQGWVSYNWKEKFAPIAVPAFAAEKRFTLSGSVTDPSNNPVSNSSVMAMATGRKTLLMIDTVTDANGRFVLKNLPEVDSLSFYIQARNQKNKKGGLQLKLDVFKPAPVGANALQAAPWYVNATDSTAVKLANGKFEFLKKKFSFDSNNTLNEVTIASKKAILRSHNLNGPGIADQVIDRAQIETDAKGSLMDLLTKRVNGLILYDSRGGQQYRIGDKPVLFVVDGWLTGRYIQDPGGQDPNYFYEQLMFSLNSIDVNDVLGIEVMTSTKNTSIYVDMNSTDLIRDNGREPAFIEITTRSGHGMPTVTSANAANYKPVPVTWPKKFYRPRYVASAKSSLTEVRPTIHWEPQLATSKTGEASTSFYSADKPGTYTVIIQGADLRGLVGYKWLKLLIK